MGEYLRRVLDHANVLVHFCSPTAPPSARIRGASVCTKRFPGRACSPDPTKEAIFHGNPRSVVLAKICRSRTVLPRRPRPSGQNASCRLILYRAARFCFQPTPERPRLWMLLCDPVNLWQNSLSRVSNFILGPLMMAALGSRNHPPTQTLPLSVCSRSHPNIS